MRIENRNLGDIRPYDNNPRLNDQAVDAVATSLREFGFRQPIAVDSDGVMVVGHTLYCDVIVERWEQFTGRKAER